MSTALAVWDHLTIIAASHPGGSSGTGQHLILAAPGDGDQQLFPDPPPQQLPEDAQNGVNMFIGYLKTIIYSAAVIAMLFVAVGMILGMRGRSNFAKDAVTHLPWLFGGVIGAGACVGILDAFA
nr:hypothetical protein [Gordonia sp. LAM0048]